MPTNQGSRQDSIRKTTGSELPFNGDWHDLFDLSGIPQGTFNGRMLEWLKLSGHDLGTLSGSQASYAKSLGFNRWGDMTLVDVPIRGWDFLAEDLPEGITNGRTDKKWVFNASGLLVEEGTAGESPRDHLPDGSPEGRSCWGAKTKEALWPRDLTNAAWVKTNATAVKDQVGLDGVANFASSLTASAANATCLQTLTAAAATKVFGVYLRRLTGTGTVEITGDGTTWKLCTLTNKFSLCDVAADGINPQFGIRLATSGDSVAVDYADVESGTYPSNPHPHTSAVVTRAADAYDFDDISFWNDAAFTAFFEGKTYDLTTGGNLFEFHAGANDRVRCLMGTAGRLLVGASTTTGTDGLITGIGQISTGDVFKAAMACENNSLNGVLDGALGTPVASVTRPPTNVATAGIIGRDRSNANYLDGMIQRLLIWPQRQTDEFLQAITS